jgi:hypothetical protein
LALSSAAYGPEAALSLLIPLGLLGVRYIIPISAALITSGGNGNVTVDGTGGPSGTATWSDSVYLSTDRTLDGSDIYLGAVPNPSSSHRS